VLACDIFAGFAIVANLRKFYNNDKIILHEHASHAESCKTMLTYDIFADFVTVIIFAGFVTMTKHFAETRIARRILQNRAEAL